jgi:signal transduction histidine kinase
MLVHDLRQPLMAFMAGLETAATLGELTPGQTEFFQMAMLGGQTLSRMIDSLLEISRFEGGSLTLDCRELEASALVEQAVRELEVLIQEKRLTLIAEVSPDLPPFRADEEKLRRTLENLLGNAIKFTPEGGMITVTARLCAEPAILFAVADSGEGIPREAFERIFEKFVQVENRQSGRTRSAGLGLASCKVAVEAHGGRIWVESEPEKGSTFFFTIPTQRNG